MNYIKFKKRISIPILECTTVAKNNSSNLWRNKEVFSVVVATISGCIRPLCATKRLSYGFMRPFGLLLRDIGCG